MIAERDWAEIICGPNSAQDAWCAIFEHLLQVISGTASPHEIHKHTVLPDRLLSESAWNLWESYYPAALRTAEALRTWWDEDPTVGRAILILDAVSLRELPFILGGAEKHGTAPEKIMVTGSELPSDTDSFAKALGASSRGQLSHNAKPAAFAFGGDDTWTDVLSVAFEDCSGFPPHRDLVLWHTWLDDQIHIQRQSPDNLSRLAEERLQSEGFWKFIESMRTGRRLVITSDHGYAAAKNFSTELREPDHLVTLLKETFGASRAKEVVSDWDHKLLPPLSIRRGKDLIVTGQRKWKIQGGFPHLCHGGASLLEVAVPFIVFPSKAGL